MKKLSSSKLVLAMLFAVISISANAQLKMSSNGYLTFGPTSTYNDGTKDYNITLRGNIWLAGPNVGHFLQIDTNPAATRIASHYDQIIFYNTGTNTYNSIQVKNVYNYSDLAAKKNIQPLGRSINSVSKLLQLKPVKYDFQDSSDRSTFKVGGDGKEIGLIAQEVKLVFPNLVLTDPDGKKLINYTALIPVLIDAVKTLTEEINTLKSMQK